MSVSDAIQNHYKSFTLCSYLVRRKEFHTISDLPSKLNQLLRRQSCLWLNIRVLKVIVLEAPTLPQKPQQITVWNVFN